jgi:branched-chain amino acid transport system substrate-binding protein
MSAFSARFLTAMGAASMVAISACGTTDTNSGGGGSGPLANCKGSVTVASELPTSGGDASIGGGTEQGVALAVQEANDSHLLGGCTINYVKKDDATVAKGKHDPQQGATNVKALANDPSVVGIVGPFNSSVAVAELPISNAAGLAQISPSNTDPGLTLKGTDPDIDTASLQPSGKVTYFRVISNDVVQAKVMAQYATQTLHLKKIFDIDDQETYGKDLSNYFDQFFAQDGGTIVGRQGLPGDTKDFRAVLTHAKGLGVDGIFFGGVASNGSGIIKLQMKDSGLDSATFLSGDGTVDPQYFKDAGASGDGNAFASSAPDTLTLGSAKGFVDKYKSKYSQDPVAYSTYGYDAMQILLQAIKKVVTDNGGNLPTDSKDFRAKVIAAVAATEYDGTIGHTSFDEHGDTKNHSFSVYSAKGGKWVPEATISA